MEGMEGCQSRSYAWRRRVGGQGWSSHPPAPTGLPPYPSFPLSGDEVKIDFLKMDIEGFEPYALAGADRLLSRHLPSVIILEYNTIMLKEGSGWAVSLLKRGYTAKDFYSLKTFAPTQSDEFEAFLNNLRDHVPSGHTDISFTIA
jgi:hypothetical protein